MHVECLHTGFWGGKIEAISSSDFEATYYNSGGSFEGLTTNSWRSDKWTNDLVWVELNRTYTHISLCTHTWILRGLVSVSGMVCIWINNEGMNIYKHIHSHTSTRTNKRVNAHSMTLSSSSSATTMFYYARMSSICVAAVWLFTIFATMKKTLEFKKPFCIKCDV